MTSANEKQVGGNHYKGREYEHWDFVDDLGLHYLVGCATKYISRWRGKNGLEDLCKAEHYLEKYCEKMDDTYGPLFLEGGKRASDLVARFADAYDLSVDEQNIVTMFTLFDAPDGRRIGLTMLRTYIMLQEDVVVGAL